MSMCVINDWIPFMNFFSFLKCAYKVCRKQILELFLNRFEMRFRISIFLFLPAPPPTPPFLPPPLLLFLHFFLLLPTLPIPFLLPLYLYPLFSFSFVFVTSLPPFIILWVLCPSTHSFPLFNQYTYSNFLCFSSFLPASSPTIIDVSFKLLFPVKWTDTEMLELFYTPKWETY